MKKNKWNENIWMMKIKEVNRISESFDFMDILKMNCSENRLMKWLRINWMKEDGYWKVLNQEMILIIFHFKSINELLNDEIY